MKIQRWLGMAALASVLVAASCDQQPPPPSDVATIQAVQAPTMVTRNVPFAVHLFAEDLGSTEYAVVSLDDRLPRDVQARGTTCNGTHPDLPSADGNWCEYDGLTTTVRSITESVYRFVWTGPKAARFSVRFCAASFTNAPDPYPTGGSCVTKDLVVAP